MEQEFVIENLKIVQDEHQWAILQNQAPNQEIAGQWLVLATFLYPVDAVNYLASCVNEVAVKKAYNRINNEN